jgi:hypothetical protein
MDALAGAETFVLCSLTIPIPSIGEENVISE